MLLKIYLLMMQYVIINVIIEACGKFIKSDAKDINQDRQVYPDVTEICDIERAHAFLPDSLRFLLQQIIVGTNADTYIASIGQAILQRCRPRILICPLQLGYSVQLHYNFGLRFFVDIASHLGFGVSYSEVQRYQANAAVSSDETELSISLVNFQLIMLTITPGQLMARTHYMSWGSSTWSPQETLPPSTYQGNQSIQEMQRLQLKFTYINIYIYTYIHGKAQ